MALVKSELFRVLHNPEAEAVLMKLYKEALKQGPRLMLHFLPKAYGLLTGKGMDWKSEKLSFYDDKYIPIHPDQGAFIYMQARATGAKNIFEFGTSYGISTIYLANAAKENGGRVITTEYLPHKVKAARQNLSDAGLADFVEILEGDARETLKTVNVNFDLVLLDGFPDMVFEIFRLIEPRLNIGAVIIVDDVDGFKQAMQDYLDYVRNPVNGYVSAALHLKKGLELSIKKISKT